MKLPQSFYLQQDVTTVAKQLLGKILVTNFDGKYCSCRITETEAYAGVTDRASHAFGGRFTNRTSIMYEAGGVAYVYLCYGIHHLFNVVTHKKGIPHAVLIRAVEPLKGIDIMMNRRQQTIINRKLTSGPGSLSKAMGIKTDHSGISLLEKHIWLEDDGFALSDSEIGISPRIGVDYAGLDATLPYRFFIKQSKWLSK